GNYIIKEETNVYATIRDKDGSKNILIECTKDVNDDNNNSCKKVVISENFPTYYLDEKTKTIISCPTGDGSCILEDPTIKGYFINSGPCIKLVDDNVNSCTTAGCIKVENSTTITLCLTDSCEESIGITSNTENLYKTITNGDFPGANGNNSISIKIGKDGSVILLEDTSLPLCNESSISSGNNACFANAINKQYCIYDKKIYETKMDDDGTTTTCTGLTISNKSIFYFDNVYNKVDDLGTRNDIMAYICTSDEQSESICEHVKGYIINNNQYIQCNGWKREGCIIETIQESPDETCTNENDEGKLLSNSKGLCFGKEKNDISDFETIPIDYIAFLTKDINPIYGINSEKIVFLSITEDSIIVTNES
ncbi:hypothetical protein PIROE2DRAFT_15000, partial [Piromyces sp. E2]